MTTQPITRTTNLDQAKAAAQRMYNQTGQDARLFLYREDDSEHYCTEHEYYYGPCQDIPENAVYAFLFYGTGGDSEPPTFEIEYF
jgi:hypothetical protein